MNEVIELEIVMECNVCGKSLSFAIAGKDRYGDPIIKVDPCDSCMKDEYNRGADNASMD